MLGCQPYAPAAFTPRKYSWYSFLLEAESTPVPQSGRKDFMSIKNPLTPVGIEPATFRFVAQHLNHCATAVPPIYIHTHTNSHTHHTNTHHTDTHTHTHINTHTYAPHKHTHTHHTNTHTHTRICISRYNNKQCPRPFHASHSNISQAHPVAKPRTFISTRSNKGYNLTFLSVQERGHVLSTQTTLT